QAVVEGVVETSIDKNIVRQIAQSTACRGRSLLAVVADRRPDIELISGGPVSPDRCLMLWRARQGLAFERTGRLFRMGVGVVATQSKCRHDFPACSQLQTLDDRTIDIEVLPKATFSTAKRIKSRSFVWFCRTTTSTQPSAS